MGKIATDTLREIVPHFARAIEKSRLEPAKPAMTVIDFRNDRKRNHERRIYAVPADLLRFRKDNGRIASDVLTYEKLHGPLIENDEKAQKKLEEFLRNKDPEKTQTLKDSLVHSGQKEPAIITVDGFLINGNRRKVALSELYRDFPQEDEYKYMRVVILPGDGEEGGPPTLKEIEQIENRYQLQQEGKAEYYNFDRALSIRSKMQKGLSLEEQLRDDPSYARLPPKEFAAAVRKFGAEFLKPLECIDRYLDYLQRDGLYDSVSKGLGDPEGRWQAFLDFSKFWEQLQDETRRERLGVNRNEIGLIQDAAFKIIRKREISTSSKGSRTGLPKVHMVMRNLPKLLADNTAKRALLELKKIPLELPEEHIIDKRGNEISPHEADNRWSKVHESQIIHAVKKAYSAIEHNRDTQAPIGHLRSALEELNHDDLLDPSAIGIDFVEEAETLSRSIRDRAKELEKQFYEFNKSVKELTRKSGDR